MYSSILALQLVQKHTDSASAFDHMIKEYFLISTQSELVLQRKWGSLEKKLRRIQYIVLYNDL